MNPTLLLIIDRELPNPFGISGEKDFYHTSLFLNNGNELIPINIKTWVNYCRATNTKFPSSVRKAFGNKNEIIADFEKQIGKTLTKKIISANSKLILNIILNSPGGHNFALKSILDIITFIKANGGVVNSFSFILVASAASYIYSFSDNRYCLKLSEFMCHASVTVPELESVFASNTEEEHRISEEIKYDEYKEHLDKFFEKHKPASTNKIKNIIEKTLAKPNCSLYIGGYNLEELGVVSRAFYDFNEFLDVLEKSVGKNIMKDKRILPFLNQMTDEYKLVLDDNSKYTQKLPLLRCPELALQNKK